MRGLLLTLLIGCTLVAGVASGRELASPSEVRPGSGDWSAADRRAWDVQSRALTGPELKQWLAASPNTFVAAALDNTQAYRHQAYADVRQRHSYYDFISYYLEWDDRAPQDSRGVRFFHAATSVTTQAELGMINSFTADHLEDTFPSIARRWGVTKDALVLLSNINADLFAKNMRVIRDLLFTWKAPRDPRAIAPREKMPNLDFDTTMVEFEQGAVQGYIASRAVPDARLSEVNKLIARGPVFPNYGTLAQVRPWLRKAGFSKDDFSQYAWRVAVGRALVFLFHKKSEEEYVGYMKAHPPERKERPKIYSGIQAPETLDRTTRGAFTIVGSWKTENGARRHIAELRRRHVGIDPVVYPPHGRDPYWTVVISSYVDWKTAAELRSRAAAHGVARDAYVLRRRAVDGADKPFVPRPLPSDHWALPYLIKAAAQETVPIPASNLVMVFQSGDAGAAAARLQELQAAYPAIPFAQFHLKEAGTYALALASFATPAETEEALALARHLNIPDADVMVASVTAPAAMERLNSVSGLQTTWAIINACYKSGKISVRALKDCSGFWLTPSTLTKCILESDCRALESGRDMTEAQVEAFLAANGLSLDTNLELKVAAIPVPTDAQKLVRDIQQCRNESQNDQRRFVACLSRQFDPGVGAAAAECAASTEKVTDMVSCIARNANDPTLAKVTACVTGEVQDAGAAALCLMGPEKAAEARKVQECLASSSSPQAMITTCGSAVLSPEQQEKVSCIARAGGNAARIAACALPASPESQAAVRAFECAERRASLTDAAGCLSGLVGGEGGRAAACIAESATREALAECMLRDRPELQAAGRAFRCASGGADTAALIANCSEGILNDDARQVASCVARNGTDREALAECAAGALLPKELGPVVQCASSSSGGVDFAVCMAGPTMNAEWRIAAECAMQSGGEPISFAGCTAGRLTVRELTKCLTGEIGKDCFGEGNTIVAAFKTVGDDLQNCLGGRPCLGENNEIVKAAKALEQGVAHLGGEVKKVWDDLFGKDSDFCRGDLTKWMCGA